MCRLFGMSGGRERVAPRSGCWRRPTRWRSRAGASRRDRPRRTTTSTIGRYVDKQPLAGIRGPGVRARGARGPLADVRRPRPLRVDRRVTLREHPPVRAARPPVRPQRRDRGPAGARGASSADAMPDVQGDTDSERFFALITREIERHAATSARGSPAPPRWVAAQPPGLRAQLRADHRSRAVGAPLPRHPRPVRARARAAPGRPPPRIRAPRAVRVRSGELGDRPCRRGREREDGRRPRAGGRSSSGELLHVDADLHVDARRMRSPDPPAPSADTRRPLPSRRLLATAAS